MRRSAIAALLALAILAVSPACLADWTGSHPSAHDLCNSGTAAHACGAALKSPSARCGFRSFVQFHFVEAASQNLIAVPLIASGKIPPPASPLVVVLAIGSPITDRGPPRS